MMRNCLFGWGAFISILTQSFLPCILVGCVPSSRDAAISQRELLVAGQLPGERAGLELGGSQQGLKAGGAGAGRAREEVVDLSQAGRIWATGTRKMLERGSAGHPGR